MDNRHHDEHLFEKSVCLPKERLTEARFLKKKIKYRMHWWNVHHKTVIASGHRLPTMITTFLKYHELVTVCKYKDKYGSDINSRRYTNMSVFVCV